MRRVAVTGLGMVGPMGMGVEPNWCAARDGQTAIGVLCETFGSASGSPAAIVTDDHEALATLPARVRSTSDRFSLFALIAASEAIADAGLCETNIAHAGAVVGCSVGGIPFLEEQYSHFIKSGGESGRTHPMTIPKLMPSAAASHISMQMGLCGPSYAVSAACASSNHAIGQAFELVRSGRSELMITGGAEASITPGSMDAWQALRVTATDTCRPFSTGRSGMVVGEGAAILILEPLKSAVARGAQIYCEIAGYGSSSDSGKITSPNVDGMALAMTNALHDANAKPSEVTYINAHGTGTILNDAAEASAIVKLFGTGHLAVSSNKSIFGHSLGAASAIEAAIVCKAIENSIIPPTANFLGADPRCPIDAVPNEPRNKSIPFALSNAFAFGGINTSLAFRQYPLAM